MAPAPGPTPTPTSNSSSNAAGGGADPGVLARRIFVQGLPYSVDSQQLREAFRRDGEVEDALVVRDGQTRKSKGFGFVTFRVCFVGLFCWRLLHLIYRV